MWRSNGWNRFIYGLWSPVYDLLAGVAPLRRGRRRAMELLSLREGESLILPGVGTGEDLRLLPPGVKAVGLDLSGPMLRRARRKLPVEGCEVTLEVGDASALPFENGVFDAAMLTLILSVVNDGAGALKEAVRVTRPGGRIVIFDKFLREGEKPGVGRRILSFLTSVFGTDINRSLEPMLVGLPCRIVCDEPGMFSGAYRAVLLEKIAVQTRG